jgi:hypothetical protein
MLNYKYKTTPYAHQRAAFEATRADPILAVLWEMGTGKSKLILDQAAWNFRRGSINGLLVWAPAGVHRLWNDLEVPKHLPDDVPRMTVTWVSGRMDTEAAQQLLSALLNFDGLAILTMNVEAAITKRGAAFAARFLRHRRTMAVVDESQTIKNPGAARTKRIVALGQSAAMRRIATGTPITQSPLDLFTQFNFLRPGLLGHSSFYAFKHEFALWRKARVGPRSFEELVGYRNLDRLIARCAPYSIRATKAECLDLPPKVYTQRSFPLDPWQRATYDELRRTYVADLADQQRVSVTHVLTRLLRLQQVTSGYWPETREAMPCPDCDGHGCNSCHDVGLLIHTQPIKDLVPPTENPRLRALLGLLGGLSADASTLVWCRFRYDVDLVTSALPGALRYDGATTQADRAEAVERFQAGDAKVLVGTPRAGGRGLTLTRASTVVYYSHDFSYETRVQSEDRAHRLGLAHSVTYVDLVAEDTVDRHLLGSVADKRDLAALFDRDDPTAFLR